MIIVFGTTTGSIFDTQSTPQLSYGTVAVQGPQRKVSVAMSGENIYFAWVTNKTGSDEVIFRSSNDAGGTFNDKITLSNTTYSSLQDVQVSAGADNVVVTWWQINSTSDEPVVGLVQITVRPLQHY